MATGKREVQAVFERLCDAIGVEPFDPKASYADNQKHGRWYVNNSSCYGGWCIERMRPAGGVDNPFGGAMSANRMPAGEFVRAMHFAISAIEVKK